MNQTGADITAAFTDPNFLAAVYEAIGKNSPEPIYDTDVSSVATLEIDSRNIESLAGLEHFRALSVLDCSNNQLNAFDVTGLALTRLDCRWNNMADESKVKGFVGSWDNEAFKFKPRNTVIPHGFREVYFGSSTTTGVPVAFNDNIRPCRVYHLDACSGPLEAVLFDDGFVLVPLPADWFAEPFEPTRIIEGQCFYAPELVESLYCWDIDHCLLPFAVDKKWGYCNTETGKVVFEPQWEFCDEFLGDYAVISVGDELDEEKLGYNYNGMFGMIDFHGNTVIQPKYQFLSDLYPHGIIFAEMNGLWGVIDIFEQPIVPFQWDSIWSYGDPFLDAGCGFIATKIVDGSVRYAILDKDGRIIIDDLTAYPERH